MVGILAHSPMSSTRLTRTTLCSYCQNLVFVDPRELNRPFVKKLYAHWIDNRAARNLVCMHQPSWEALKLSTTHGCRSCALIAFQILEHPDIETFSSTHAVVLHRSWYERLDPSGWCCIFIAERKIGRFFLTEEPLPGLIDQAPADFIY